MKDLEKEESQNDDIDNLMGDLMKADEDCEDTNNSQQNHQETEENMKILDWMSGEKSMPKFKQRNMNFIPEDQEIEDFSDEDHLQDFDDRKTTFTQYSMSSSVMRRSEHLTQIDDTFESVVEELYNDEDM